jgi:hypothetical protein
MLPTRPTPNPTSLLYSLFAPPISVIRICYPRTPYICYLFQKEALYLLSKRVFIPPATLAMGRYNALDMGWLRD